MGSAASRQVTRQFPSPSTLTKRSPPKESPSQCNKDEIFNEKEDHAILDYNLRSLGPVVQKEIKNASWRKQDEYLKIVQTRQKDAANQIAGKQLFSMVDVMALFEANKAKTLDVTKLLEGKKVDPEMLKKTLHYFNTPTIEETSDKKLIAKWK